MAQIGARQHEHPEHPVGAVDQRQALLGAQLERRDLGVGERVRGGHALAAAADVGLDVDVDLALADERERAVGERGEIAARPERAVLRARPA